MAEDLTPAFNLLAVILMDTQFKCNGVDVSAVFFVHVLNKYIGPSLKSKVSILYTPQSPLKSLKI